MEASKRDVWLAERCGSLTASSISPLFVKPKDKMQSLSVGAMTYVKKKCAELLTGVTPESFTTKEMQWGLDNEQYAIKALEEFLKVEINYFGNENPKFFSLTDFSGASPDGYFSKTILDVKCPNSDTHLDFLMLEKEEDKSAALKEYAKEYWHQLQMGAVCLQNHGVVIDKCMLVSYDPRFRKEFQLAVIEFEIDLNYKLELLELISKAESEMRTILKKLGI